jgi:hypothetical protein
MSQEYSSARFTPDDASLSWHEVWIRALTRPSVATFERLLRDPYASSGTAYAWVFYSALVGTGLASLVQSAFPDSVGASSVGAGVICGAPVAAVLSVLGLIVTAGITQFVAGLLGGIGTYRELVYATAAYLAPLSLIESVVGEIPVFNYLLIPLALYGIALNVIAVKAVNRFGWGSAIAASVLVFVGIVVMVAIAVFAFLALLGPAITS